MSLYLIAGMGLGMLSGFPLGFAKYKEHTEKSNYPKGCEHNIKTHRTRVALRLFRLSSAVCSRFYLTPEMLLTSPGTLHGGLRTKSKLRNSKTLVCSAQFIHYACPICFSLYDDSLLSCPIYCSLSFLLSSISCEFFGVYGNVGRLHFNPR